MQCTFKECTRSEWADYLDPRSAAYSFLEKRTSDRMIIYPCHMWSRSNEWMIDMGRDGQTNRQTDINIHTHRYACLFSEMWSITWDGRDHGHINCWNNMWHMSLVDSPPQTLNPVEELLHSWTKQLLPLWATPTTLVSTRPCKNTQTQDYTCKLYTEWAHFSFIKSHFHDNSCIL